jgi:hypothetical protein
MNIQYAGLDEMQAWARARMQRLPDFVIGDPDRPYMRRWWIVPRNEGCNVYLHEILRSDDDRAGHDHPWANTSFVIEGGYDEVIYQRERPWEESHTVARQAGDCVTREATDTHRLIVPEGGRCISLFMTGPKVREWGFWCPNGERFVHWRDFTAGANGEVVGRGCEQDQPA